MTEGSKNIFLKTLDGVTLHGQFWESFGHSDVLLFCHGLQGHSGWAQELAEFFQNIGLDTYAFDRRGSGQSTGRQGDIKEGILWIQDLIQIVGHIKNQRPGKHIHLIAMGWGVKAALILAMFYPRLVDSLILLSPDIKTRGMISRFDRYFLWPLCLYLKPKAYFRINYTPSKYTQTDPYLGQIRQDQRKFLRATARFIWHSFKMQLLYLRHPHKIQTPIFTLLGSADMIIRKKDVIRFHQELGSIKKTIKVYPLVAHHVLFSDNKMLIFEDIRSWIQDVSETLPKDSTVIASPQITTIELYEINIPTKRSKIAFKKSSLRESHNLIIKVTLDGGVQGFGECVLPSSIDLTAMTHHIRDHYLPPLEKQPFSSYHDVIRFCQYQSENKNHPSDPTILCALETSLLDAFGIFFNRSISDICGPPQKQSMCYAHNIVLYSRSHTWWAGLCAKLQGYRDIKFYITDKWHVEHLSWFRRLLGHTVSFRIDAQESWQPEEAREWIKKITSLNVSCLEQPLARDQLEELSFLSKHSHIPISADESLTSLAQAKRLQEMKCCHMFNIKISKCGGLLQSLAIKKIADQHGIRCYIGDEFGQTSILSSLGRHLAFAFKNIDFVEGSHSTRVLKNDLSFPPVNYFHQGYALPIAGKGLGLLIDQNVIDQYTQHHTTLRLGSHDTADNSN